MIVNFTNDVFSFGIIFRVISQDDGALSEGDVINIEPTDNPIKADLNSSNLPTEEKCFREKLHEVVFGNFAYNITFLIELDPL